jgi:serine/threonine protein phosphatase 1
VNWISERVEHWLRRSPPSLRKDAAPARALNLAGPDSCVAAAETPLAEPPLHYGVGDIHGMRAELDRLLGLIEADADAASRDATIVFLGDLINRGPSSRQVLERLIAGPERAGHKWITLRGNHDQLFLDAVGGKNETAFQELMRKGGAETLASYGLRKKDATLARARRAVPSDHLRFIESLPLSYASGDFVFVHAGVDPLRPLDRQPEKTLMTIREPFLRNAHLLPYTVVHGHVANPKGPVIASRRICVDTGAHMTGVLTAVAICPKNPARFLSTARG